MLRVRERVESVSLEAISINKSKFNIVTYNRLYRITIVKHSSLS
jgi:hypothetical protein